MEKFIRGVLVLGGSLALRAGLLHLGLWTVNIPSPGFLKLALVVFIVRAVVYVDPERDVVP